MDIIQQIKTQYHSMSRGHKQVADYVLSQTDTFIYQSSAQVAQQLGLSESTVVRFASVLGFSKYKELLKGLKAQLANRLDIIDQFCQHAPQKDDLLYPFRQDLINIQETVRGLEPDDIRRAADMIIQARYIGVVALRGAVAPALILSQFLNELLDNTRLLTPGNGDSYDAIKRWDQRDLLICCEFIPYQGFVYKMLDYGKRRGCGSIAIVGNLASCLIPLSDITLEVKKDGTFISYAAANVVVDMLLHAVSQRNSAHSVQSLGEMQEILRLANGCPEKL